MKPLSVQADRLAFRRGGRLVLEHISFSAASGDFLVFTGPNGIGKSTLLRGLAGLGEISSGSLTIPLEETVFLGHLNGLKPHLTGSENLRFWIKAFGHQAEDTNSNIFGLRAFVQRQVKHLSSGQRRKLALATTILSGRKIWLLDEPTSGLDQDACLEFSALADQHCFAGGIIIASTHASFACKTCEYRSLLRQNPVPIDSAGTL